MPRVYFVNGVEVKSGLQILDMIKNNEFDPKNVAFVDDSSLKVDKPDSTVYSNITDYKDQLIKADVNASGNNFLFLGDTYLPAGWKAYIDGNKTKVYKANHDFMGIVVPKGKHVVEFRYAPESFYISKYMVLILSSVTLLGLILTIGLEVYKKNASK